MAKPKRRFVCQACGGVTTQWQGRCDACGEWNTIVEEITDSGVGAGPKSAKGNGRPGAPPVLRPRGSNHVGMRQFNERIVLQAIRHHGAIPKADLARLTQLSTQTVAIIVGRLLDDEIGRASCRERVSSPV